jgi:hypothetical protein
MSASLELRFHAKVNVRYSYNAIVVALPRIESRGRQRTGMSDFNATDASVFRKTLPFDARKNEKRG